MGMAGGALRVRWPGVPADPERELARPRLRLPSLLNAAFDPASAGPPRRRRYHVADLVALAWHSRWILLAAAVIGIAIGLTLQFVATSTHQASALLLSPDSDPTRVASDLSIARSDALAQVVAAQVGPNVTIAAQLDGPGRVVRLTADDATGADALRALQAAIVGLQAARRGAYVAARADVLMPQFEDARRLEAAIAADAERVRKEAGVLDIGQEIAAIDAAAAGLARRAGELRERQTAVRAELARSRDLLRGTPEQVPYSRELTRNDANDEQRTALLRLRLERAHLATMYAPDYPGVIELDRKIAIAARPQKPSSASLTRERRNVNYDALAAKVSGLQIEGDSLAVRRNEVARQASEATARAATLGTVAATLATLRQRQTMQEEVVHGLSLEIARLRSQDALDAARIDDLRILQQPTLEATPWRPSMGWLGLLAGLLGGIVASIVVARRREVYVVGCEAERNLALREVGSVSLGRPAGLKGLAACILDNANAAGAPLATIHLIGTDDQDGTDEIARALAHRMSSDRGRRVLMVRLSRDGRGEMQSLTASAQPAPLPRSSMLSTMPERAQPTPAAAEIVCALFGDETAIDAELQPQIARLRAIHGAVVVVSAHGLQPAVTCRLSALADIDVLVVRARRSPAASVARLRDLVTSAAGRVPGFVFTDAPFAWRSRRAGCA